MRHLLILLALLLVFIPLASAQQPTGMPTPDAYTNLPEPDATVGPVAPAPKVDPAAPAPKTGDDKKEPAAEGDKKDQPVGPPQKQPEDVVEAFQTGNFMIEAAKEGWWSIFAGLLIMLLIFLADKVIGIKEKVGPKALPWVAAGLGIVATIAAQLTTGVDWKQALLQGFTAGASAVGLWELVFKHLLKAKAEEKTEPGKTDAA